jgi:hypothetical protein
VSATGYHRTAEPTAPDDRHPEMSVTWLSIASDRKLPLISKLRGIGPALQRGQVFGLTHYQCQNVHVGWAGRQRSPRRLLVGVLIIAVLLGFALAASSLLPQTWHASLKVFLALLTLVGLGLVIAGIIRGRRKA